MFPAAAENRPSSLAKTKNSQNYHDDEKLYRNEANGTAKYQQHASFYNSFTRLTFRETRRISSSSIPETIHIEKDSSSLSLWLKSPVQ